MPVVFPLPVIAALLLVLSLSCPVIATTDTQQELESTNTTLDVINESRTPDPSPKFAAYMTQGNDPQIYVDRYEGEVAYKQWFDAYFAEMSIRQAVGLTAFPVADPDPKFAAYMTHGDDPQIYVDRYEGEVAYKQWFDAYFAEMSIREATGLDAPQRAKVPQITSVSNDNDVAAPIPGEIDQAPSQDDTVVEPWPYPPPKVILDPRRHMDEIPQDRTYDYVLHVPPGDPDALAKIIAEHYEDRVVGSSVKDAGTVDEHIRFDTLNGHITIPGYESIGDRGLEYFIMPPAETWFHPDSNLALFDKLGIEFDGTEYVDFQLWWQKKDGVIVNSNKINRSDVPHISSDSLPALRIQNWNSNLSEMDLYDFDTIVQNGRDYVRQSELFVGPECDVYIKERQDKNKKLYNPMYVIGGRPVYEVASGSCSLVTWYESNVFKTIVDGITGEPLFISRVPEFYDPITNLSWPISEAPPKIPPEPATQMPVLDAHSAQDPLPELDPLLPAPRIILDPADYHNVIPQDITYDYLFPVTIDTPDEFARMILAHTGDKIITKQDLNPHVPNDSIRYTTRDGYILIFTDELYSRDVFSYNINKASRSVQFMHDLLGKIGIVLDDPNVEKEVEPHSFISGFTEHYWQQIDGIRVNTNRVSVISINNNISISFTNWNTNLEEIDLYPLDGAVSNAKDYVRQFKLFTGPECMVHYPEYHDYDGAHSLHILYGRPIYDILSGACSADALYQSNLIYTTVDGFTGKPLFISSMPEFYDHNSSLTWTLGEDPQPPSLALTPNEIGISPKRHTNTEGDPWLHQVPRIILDREKIAYAIPHDSKIDYALKLPPSVPDVFAHDLATYMDDRVIGGPKSADAFTKSESSDSLRYVTEGGQITIDKYEPFRSPKVSYQLNTYRDIADPNLDDFAHDIMRFLGIELDGTEIFHDYPGVYEYRQTLDGMTIRLEDFAVFDSDLDSVTMYTSQWINNPSEIDLYDMRKAVKNGRDYVRQFELFTGPECILHILPQFNDADSLHGINYLIMRGGYLLYDVYAGQCDRDASTHDRTAIRILVDGFTGEPLFIHDIPLKLDENTYDDYDETAHLGDEFVLQ